jgi:hypothetical protein
MPNGFTHFKNLVLSAQPPPMPYQRLSRLSKIRTKMFADGQFTGSAGLARPPCQGLLRPSKIRTQVLAGPQLAHSGGSAQPPLMPCQRLSRLSKIRTQRFAGRQLGRDQQDNNIDNGKASFSSASPAWLTPLCPPGANAGKTHPAGISRRTEADSGRHRQAVLGSFKPQRSPPLYRPGGEIFHTSWAVQLLTAEALQLVEAT